MKGLATELLYYSKAVKIVAIREAETIGISPPAVHYHSSVRQRHERHERRSQAASSLSGLRAPAFEIVL